MSLKNDHKTPNREQYQRYLEGDRKGSEAHELEKSALSDPFEADALEGYEQLEGQIAADDIDDLSQRIPTRKKGFRLYRIAAFITVLLVAGISIWLTIPEKENDRIAAKSEETVEESAEMVAETMDTLGDQQIALSVEPEQTEDLIPEVEEESSQVLESDLADSEGIGEEPLITQVTEDSTEDLIASEPSDLVAEVTSDTQSMVVEVDESLALLDETADELSEEFADAGDEVLETAPDETEKMARSAVSESPAPTAARESEPVAEERTLFGVVRDQDGFPLPGVEVLLNGGSYSSVTDAQGAYQMTVPNLTSMRLIFSNPDYRPTELPVSSDEIDVSLSKNARGTVEIMLVGVGPGNNYYESGMEPPSPAGGLEAFIAYFEASKVASGPGLATLLIQFDAEGGVSSLSVERSLNQDVDREIQDLINSWTFGWSAARYQGNSIESTARLKFRYR